MECHKVAFFGAFFVDDHDLEHVFDYLLVSVSRSRVPFWLSWKRL